jgi:uncharacterized protein (DUF736 family)
MDKPVSFTGLWKRKSQKGVEYLSAACNVDDLIKRLQQIKTAKCNVMVFRNTKREGKNDPDWTISLGEWVEREQQPAPPKQDEFSDKPKEDCPF